MSDQTQEDLDAAADLIEATSWHRGGGHGPPYCAATAVTVITGMWDGTVPREVRHGNYARFEAAMDVLADRILATGYAVPGLEDCGLRDMVVWHWNDELDRTVDDVLELLRGADLA